MITRFHLLRLAASAAACDRHAGILAQSTIKIGELNSYKAQPAFLDPYKKGWEFAIEEINAKGSVLGKARSGLARRRRQSGRCGPRRQRTRLPKRSTSSPAPSSSHIEPPSPSRRPGEGVLPRRRAYFDRQDPPGRTATATCVPPAPSTYMRVCDADPRGGCQQALGGDLSQLRIRPVGRLVVQGDAQEAQPDVEFDRRPSPRSVASMPAPWCRRSTTWPTACSTCCSGPTSPSWCAKAAPRRVRNRAVVALLSGEPEYRSAQG